MTFIKRDNRIKVFSIASFYKLIIFKFTVEDLAACKIGFALTVQLPVQELTLVDIAVHVGDPANAGKCAHYPLALVIGVVGDEINTPADFGEHAGLAQQYLFYYRRFLSPDN